MATKIRSRARQLRLELSAKLGRSVSIREVAEGLGVDRRVVMKLENQLVTERPDMEVLSRLADFYHSQGLDARGIVVYDPDAIRTPTLALTVNPAR